MDKNGRYNTKQRDRIRSYLQDNNDKHITADDIYEAFKEEGCPIGASTIYRYLDLLVKEGTVRKFIVEKGSPACYQYFGASPHCNEHFHLKCDKCGKLFHIESIALSQAAAEIKQSYGFKLDHSKTVLYGLCNNCHKEEIQ